MNIELTARQQAGLAKATAASNANRPPESQIEPEAFALVEFGVIADQWAALAPVEVPLGDWLQKWTPEEQAGALTVAAGNEQLRGLWLTLLNTPQVNREDERLAPGVQAMCGALEAIGVIAAGEAATRAAAILAY